MRAMVIYPEEAADVHDMLRLMEVAFGRSDLRPKTGRFVYPEAFLAL